MPFSLPITDAAGIFFVVLALMLLAHFLTDRLRIPSLVGLVAAGILVGPSCLNIVARGAVVSHLGEIGLVYAFFLLGVDMDFSRQRHTKGVHAAYALLLSLLPLCIAVAALVLGFSTPLVPALFLGLVIASQSLLPSPVIQKLGLGKSRPYIAAESATQATEAFRIIALAVLAAVWRKQGSSLAWLLALGTLAAYAIILYLVLPRLAALFFRRAKANDTIEFIFVLALAFLCAYLGRLAGLDPFVGAFIAGALLGRFFPERSSLEKRIRFAGEWLFVPFFFVAMGMDIDFRIFTASLWPLALGLGLTAFVLVAKGGAAALMRPLAGFTRDEAALAFGLTTSQAVSAVAVAGVAYSIGGLDDGFLFAVIVASLLTSVIGPVIARGSGGRLALAEMQSSRPEAATPERIMIGVSNPARIDHLIELAFFFRKRGSAEPVIPVCIVPESEDSELELSKAEGLLARAIVRANEAGVPVTPAANVSVSAAEGLKAAAEEKGANTIIVGWSRAPKFSRAIFGSVIEQLLDVSPGLVVVARIAKPAREISRVVLVLPPLIEHHPGYSRGLSTLSTFLARTGSHLSIYAQKPGGQAARDAAGKLKARGQVQISELNSWKDVASAARAANSGNAAFAVFCVRPGGPAWHPAVEKLPHILEDEFPASPILLFYLPELPVEASLEKADAQPAPAQDLFASALSGGRVIPAMTETAVTDGIRELLRRSFGDNRKTLARLATQLTEIAQKSPIELEPGVVLLHAHVAEVTEPIVFFGARPDGFRILALDTPAKVLVVLCSPEDLPPEAHLSTLGDIARLFKDKGLAARLLEAKSVSELDCNNRTIEEEEID